MAYMPLNKAPQMLDDSTMPKIYDLSMPWGVDTPLWPFPGARQDLVFPRGQYLGRFHKRTMTYTGTLHAGTRKRWTGPATATTCPRSPCAAASAPASSWTCAI